MRLFALSAVLALGLTAAAQDPAPAAGGLELTLSVSSASVAAGDDLQLEVTLTNKGDKDVDATELMFEERSVSFHVKATYEGGKISEYDLALLRPDPWAALRLPIDRVTVAKGRSVSMIQRIPALARGKLEIKANYRNGDEKLQSAAANVEVTGTSLVAVMDTTNGAIKIELDHLGAPANVTNFVRLAKMGFYDDLAFHRVVRTNWIQSGCPYGLGTGGPGWAVKAELNPQAAHEEGTVSMSSFGNGYTGSQFFICASKLPAFDGKYTVIGKVDAANLSTVQAIAKVEVDKNTDRPKSEVKIRKVTVSPK